MSKKNVNIKIGSDVEEAKKGINTISNQLNQLSKNIQKQQKPLRNFLDSFNAVGKALGLVKSAFSAVTDAVNDTINAYNTQTAAEKQLEAAAKNNPYLSDYSVDQLKKYASELQSISTVGDEELLPMMAQLAAAGRTQAEIQDIMAASLDISASGAMSFESAVKNLNKTFSGLSGELGEVNPQIKALSAEELKNGEAVKVLQKQYSGIAKTVADSTGGWQQFKNTWGDLKEIIGSTFANLQNSAGKVLNGFFGTIIEKLQAASKEADEFKKKLGIITTLDDDNASVTELNGVIEQLEKSRERLSNMALVANEEQQKVKDSIAKSATDEAEKAKAELAQLENDLLSAQDGLYKFEAQIEELNKKYLAAGSEDEKERIRQLADSVNAEQAAATETVRAWKLKVEEKEKEVAALEKSARQSKKIAEKEVQSLNEAFSSEFFGSKKSLLEEQKKVEEQLTLAIQKRDAAQKEADKQAGKSARDEANQKALDIIKANNAELQKNIAAIERKYSLMEQEGQKIDEAAKAQEILSAQESAYLKLISEDTTVVTENNSVAKARLAEIKESYEKVIEAVKKKAEAENDKKALEELEKETEKLTEEARKFVSTFSDSKLSTQIEKSIARLEEMKTTLGGNVEEADKLQKKIDELSGLLDKVKAKEAENAPSDLENWAKIHEKKIQIVSNFAGKYAEIMQGVSDLACQTAKNEAKVKQAELEKQLAVGEISEEEYAKKKEQIEKEAAEKQYKMQMWAWASNLLNIQAQTALAVVQALANSGPPYIAIPMAALIGTLGAVQLSTAISNKPVPPSFATGGVVGGFQGASMGGDNTYIHARNGEMILNAAQQKAMWKQLNGGIQPAGRAPMNVTIKNSAANTVSATPRMTESGLEVVIGQIVKKQMENGDYDTSMRLASLKESGIRYVD